MHGLALLGSSSSPRALCHMSKTVLRWACMFGFFWLGFFLSSPCFAMLLWVEYFPLFFYSFLAHILFIQWITYKTRYFTKTMEIVSNNLLSMWCLMIFCVMLVGFIIELKTANKLPNTLPFARPRGKVWMTKVVVRPRYSTSIQVILGFTWNYEYLEWLPNILT